MRDINQDKLHAFIKNSDASWRANTVSIAWVGDKLGLYKALHAAGPMTVEQSARKTGIANRYGYKCI